MSSISKSGKCISTIKDGEGSRERGDCQPASLVVVNSGLWKFDGSLMSHTGLHNGSGTLPFTTCTAPMGCEACCHPPLSALHHNDCLTMACFTWLILGIMISSSCIFHSYIKLHVLWCMAKTRCKISFWDTSLFGLFLWLMISLLIFCHSLLLVTMSEGGSFVWAWRDNEWWCVRFGQKRDALIFNNCYVDSRVLRDKVGGCTGYIHRT